ncbi:porin [Kushneria phosphatilytica]|uniref:Porin n=1 Tax=Kushneria phosphatilytica TaxID=657387 RepID=A0A1S1NXG0_9GAMM|nr:porin [Kushneria phosphatilytica]OHV10888.1 porin [Kushneria phosphatilytica]QEL12028.1 porin [Kushneria phosphatilytica]
MTFNRTRLALSVCTATLLFSQQALAVNLYEDTQNRLEFSGRIAAGSSYVDDIEDDHDVVNAGSRVRLIYEHNFTDGWSSIARAEWGFDPFYRDGSDAHYKRMLYAGVSNDEYGTILIGKQYSMWYDMVAYWTDWFWYNGATAQGSFNGRDGDGGFEGNGRPDRAISYKNTWGDWSVGLLFQTSRDDHETDSVPEYTNIGGQQLVSGYRQRVDGFDRKYTGQGAVVWQPVEDWSFGATYTHSSIDAYTTGEEKDEDVDAGLLAARWTPGNWYFALTAGEYHNLVRSDDNFGNDEGDGIVDKARGYEGVALYNLKQPMPGTVQLYTGLNRLENTDTDARQAFYLAGVAWLTFNENLILSVERKFDDSKGDDGSDVGHDETDLLVRYNF